MGPIMEEVFHRGIVTRLLLRKYHPWKAIAVSGLIFAIVHLNPAQFVPAFTSGMFYAWLYYRTRSLWPGIVLHVLNNGFAAFMMQAYPETEDMTLTDMLGQTGYIYLLIGAVVIFIGSVWGLNRMLPAGVSLISKKEEEA